MPDESQLTRRRVLLAFARRELIRPGDEMIVVPNEERPLFLLPVGSNTLAVRSLLAHNRLRVRGTQLRRVAVAGAFGLGLGRLATPTRVSTTDDAEGSLIEALATALDEPGLSFAMGLSRFGAFAKPVLQLFSPAGSSVGFAKVGWTDATAPLVRTEARALHSIAAAGSRLYRSPELLHEFDWHDMPVIVTSPVPVRSRRLAESEFPVVAPIWEIARLLGPPRERHIAALGAVARLTTEDGAVADAVAMVVDALGEVAVPTGAAHGDLVTWNLALQRNRLWVWDWEHFAGDAPVGLDVVHGLFQQFHLIHRRPLRTALAEADAVARPHLARLGLDSHQQAAVIAAHRLALLDRFHQGGAPDAPSVAGILASLPGSFDR